MPVRSYALADAAKRVRSKYGRVVNERLLRSRSKQLFGKTDNLSPRELIKLINTLNVRRLALSPEKKEQVKQHLLINQKMPLYERKSFEQISREVAHPRAQISKGMMKTLNSPVRAQVRARGGKPSKFFNVDPNKAKVLGNIRKVLSENHNISIEAAAASVGLSRRQLQRILPHYKTSFDSEQRKAKVALIEKLDSETGRALTNQELADRLGMKENYISKERTRRGRGAGVNARVGKLKGEMLSWLGAFTTPETGEVRLNTLMALTNSSKLTALNAVTQLKKQRLIYEVDRNGSERYSVSPSGIRELNSRAAVQGSRYSRMESMPVEQLERIYSNLLDAKLHQGEVSSRVLELIRNQINRKRVAALK